jgi:hypothetical protein
MTKKKIAIKKKAIQNSKPNCDVWLSVVKVDQCLMEIRMEKWVDVKIWKAVVDRTVDVFGGLEWVASVSKKERNNDVVKIQLIRMPTLTEYNAAMEAYYNVLSVHSIISKLDIEDDGIRELLAPEPACDGSKQGGKRRNENNAKDAKDTKAVKADISRDAMLDGMKQRWEYLADKADDKLDSIITAHFNLRAVLVEMNQISELANIYEEIYAEPGVLDGIIEKADRIEEEISELTDDIEGVHYHKEAQDA